MQTSTGLPPPAAGPGIRDAYRALPVWSRVEGAHRNMDTLPDHFLPGTGGCPACGSVWVELDALKLGTTLIREIEPTSGLFLLVYGSQLVKGVRLLCFEGHAHEHVPPDLLQLLGGVMVGGIAMLSYAYLAGKRG